MTLIDDDELAALKKIANASSRIRELSRNGLLKLATTHGNEDIIADAFSDSWVGLDDWKTAVESVEKN